MIPSNKMLSLMSKQDRAPMGKAGVTTKEANAKHEALAEREIQRQIEAWLRSQEFYFVRSRMDRKTSVQVGTPDYIVSAYGCFVAFEVKTATGKLSEAQERAGAQIQANAGRFHVVRSLAEVVSILKDLAVRKEMRG